MPVYQLNERDVEVSERARAFVDQLIPYEAEAERRGGELPPEVARQLTEQAREQGLLATNMPTELGGGGYTMLQQVLVQEQVGRITNGLAWMLSTPPQWWPSVATDYQLERYL